MIVKEELIEDDVDSSNAQTLTKHADAPFLRVILLPVAEEYFGHEELILCFVPNRRMIGPRA